MHGIFPSCEKTSIKKFNLWSIKETQFQTLNDKEQNWKFKERFKRFASFYTLPRGYDRNHHLEIEIIG